MRLRVWLIAVFLFVAAGCGSGSSGSTSGGTADVGGSLESLWKRPGLRTVAVIAG